MIKNILYFIFLLSFCLNCRSDIGEIIKNFDNSLNIFKKICFKDGKFEICYIEGTEEGKYYDCQKEANRLNIVHQVLVKHTSGGGESSSCSSLPRFASFDQIENLLKWFLENKIRICTKKSTLGEKKIIDEYFKNIDIIMTFERSISSPIRKRFSEYKYNYSISLSSVPKLVRTMSTGDLRHLHITLGRETRARSDSFSRGESPAQREEITHHLTRNKIDYSLLSAAKEENCIIITRPVNESSYSILGEGDALAKGIECKAKSADKGYMRGYIPAQAQYSKVKAQEVEKYQKIIDDMLKGEKAHKKPFMVDGKILVRRDGIERLILPTSMKANDEVMEVLIDPKTDQYLTSDVDLFMISCMGDKDQKEIKDEKRGILTARELQLIEKINKIYSPQEEHGASQEIVRHGAENRNPNSTGIDYPLNVYLPDESSFTIPAGPEYDPNQHLRKFLKSKESQKEDGEGFHFHKNPNWKWP